MVDIKTLLPELKDLVVELAEDLLARATSDAKIDAGLREAFQQIEKGGRTAQAFEVWRDDYLDQVAVAWVLACVFVRFMEDNQLIDECWLAGEGVRRKLAEDTHELYFREHPHDTDREYFEHVFREVGKIPAAKDLFAEGKTPLWAVAPSGDATMKLLKFWREMDGETGHLQRSFSVENGDTRFLGDLYQDLSERAKKKFALLQTPIFVEEFILDRTLSPAIAEFGLDNVRMIDPTCGSGHFLLGGFARLFREWSKPEYTTGNERKDVQKALDGVWGVDINPFAVAIARFRLIVAATIAGGMTKFSKHGDGWNIHLASGDSLLFGRKANLDGERVGIAKQLNLFEAPDIYAVEDQKTLQEILGQGYHVVVGNPPYIIVRDRVQNAIYRELYSACGGKYSLGVPFTQRFWELAFQSNESEGGSGHVGLITTNSFMKREFGKKLIEDFLPKIDLTHVIDTSGAYIPGHGTPTVILLGRNRKPTEDSIRAVQGITGEPSTPEDASRGFVWQSILKLIDLAGNQNEFISTSDVPRSTFASHPWSIGGGGVSELKELIDEAGTRTLSDCCDIGIGAVTLEDDAYHVTSGYVRRHCVPLDYQRGFVSGDLLRDWSMLGVEPALFPHNPVTFKPSEHPTLLKLLWPFKTGLSNRLWFRKTQIERGMKWFEYGFLSTEKLRAPLTIAFAEVATHNHFVLDRGGKVFNQTAPSIKLPSDASEETHLALLGLLNSSTACFWLKQVCHNKGSAVDQHGARQRTAPFEDFYQLNGTRVGHFPIPEMSPVCVSRQMDVAAQEYIANLPDVVVKYATPTADRLAHVRQKATSMRGRMIALQEELDWHCYQLYGLLSDDLRYNGDDLPELVFGQRAFEIVLANQMAKGKAETTWFERHGSLPITDIPMHWPESYRNLVARRVEVIKANKAIGLIEKPEFKRRWNDESWEVHEQRALRNWLLDRLETTRYWPASKTTEPSLQSTAQVADKASSDHEFMEVAGLYRGRSDFDLGVLVAELITSESVPFLPVLCYKPAGLRKREVWERTWELQRREDQLRHDLETFQKAQAPQEHIRAQIEALGGGEKEFQEAIREQCQSYEQRIESLIASAEVPPRYSGADYLKTDYWRLRGKLDVPKERWVSYPHCSTESDPSLVVGWAGWNHLQQAMALIAYYDARKREGWDAKRLKPLLAGLDQLLPWIHQWHPEIDPEFGETAGKSYQTLLAQDAHELGLTMDDIRNWQPPATTARRRTTRTK